MVFLSARVNTLIRNIEMRNVPVVILSAIYFWVSTLCGSDQPQSTTDSASTTKFSPSVSYQLPDILKPFVKKETSK
jgi:hypothetical protein